MKLKIDNLHDYDVEAADIPDEATFQPKECHSVVCVRLSRKDQQSDRRMEYTY
jgi:hypothetical protein